MLTNTRCFKYSSIRTIIFIFTKSLNNLNMSTAFKDLYSREFIRDFGLLIAKFKSDFDVKVFQENVLHGNWKELELKERMRKITLCMHNSMNLEFPEVIPILIKVAQEGLRNRTKFNEIVCLSVPDYLAQFGMNHFELCMNTFPEITEFATCEFAIRPFILANPERAVQIILTWTNNSNEHVRRLASEGTRSRLPWGMALGVFKKDPSSILPILDQLKNDDSEYVRRSVANNLNDISKDNPEVTMSLAKSWIGINSNTKKLVKHALRTQLKAGDQEALKLFGLGYDEMLSLQKFELITQNVQIGEDLTFDFEIKNLDDKDRIVRVEYVIYFLLKNGNFGKKVFKISERNYCSKEIIKSRKNHKFKIITTRKYYPGNHAVSLSINGMELQKTSFTLKD